jgi:hypothetical protein
MKTIVSFIFCDVFHLSNQIEFGSDCQILISANEKQLTANIHALMHQLPLLLLVIG